MLVLCLFDACFVLVLCTVDARLVLVWATISDIISVVDISGLLRDIIQYPPRFYLPSLYRGYPLHRYITNHKMSFWCHFDARSISFWCHFDARLMLVWCWCARSFFWKIVLEYMYVRVLILIQSLAALLLHDLHHQINKGEGVCQPIIIMKSAPRSSGSLRLFCPRWKRR